ncbi:hypothetical protein E3D81_04975 [Sphingobacterium sp. CZ-2]|nr:hypothetical protein E3D81_04975 [Sphingobacterium sp. CZ-2]
MNKDNNYELVYLGSILNGNDILQQGNFNLVFGYNKLPIRISTSINGAQSKIISIPRLSTFRQTVQDVLRGVSIKSNDISSFSFYSNPFNDYSEISQHFGHKVNTRSLFSSSSSSVSNVLTTIKKKNGIISTFELINFTIDMSLPRADELISEVDIESQLLNNPVYISSISYGQKGIFAIESDFTKEEIVKVFEKVTKKIFKKTTETITSTDINIINNSTIRVFLAGGPNSGSVSQINGYLSFLNYVTELGDFSADNPGYPITFQCRQINDYSLFRTY